MESSGQPKKTVISQLKQAVKNRDAKAVRNLLDENPDINNNRFEEIKLLHLFLHNVDSNLELQESIVEILRLFLDRGANVNFKNDKGQTLIHLAIKKKMKVVIDFLISHNANLDVRDRCGNPLTHFLIDLEFRCQPIHQRRQKHKNTTSDFVEWMISKGLDVDSRYYNKDTALHDVLKKNLKNYLKLILKHSKNIDTIDDNGNTALNLFVISYFHDNYDSYHSLKENEKLIRVFLSKGANVHKVNDEGYSPIINAVMTRNLEVLMIFKNEGADFLRYYRGGNLLHYFFESATRAGKRKYYKAVLDLLINEGCDINFLNDKGMSPLHVATRRIERGNTERYYLGIGINEGSVQKFIMRRLIEHGALIDVKNNDGYLPLQIAILRQDERMIKELLKHGADVNDNSHVFKDEDYALSDCETLNEHLIKLEVAELPIDRNVKGFLKFTDKYAE